MVMGLAEAVVASRSEPVSASRRAHLCISAERPTGPPTFSRLASALVPRGVRIHDTPPNAPKLLEPRDPGKVGIYACGPTVYGRIHVGNARPFVVFSLLRRFLAHEGYNVAFVANITDVNDKIYDAAAAAGIGSERLAREMTAAYRADTDLLGIG